MSRSNHTLSALIALIFLCFTAFSSASVFYVSPAGDDGNPGTQDQPWRSLIYAALTVRAGDTVLIADGDYAGGVKIGGIKTPNPGRADAPITFRAINPGGPTVWGDVSASTDAFWISNSDWVVVEGLTIRNASRVGLYVDVSHHVTVRHCILLNNRTQGILTSYSDDTDLEYNECAYSIEQHGIYLSCSGDRAILRNNVCHDNAECGIQFNGNGKGVKPSFGTHGDGIIQDCQVIGNILYNNGLVGSGAALNLLSVRSSLIADNLIYNNGAGTIAMGNDNLASATQWGCKNNRIIHNTVFCRPSQGRWCVEAVKGSSNNVVLNNILVGGVRGAYMMDTSSSIISDYNLIPAAGTTAVASYLATNTYYTLPQWQAFSGNDQHSLMADPAFANSQNQPFDFHLRDWSPAVAFAPALPDSPFDLDGNPRPATGLVDVGCYNAGNVSTYSVSGHVLCAGVGVPAAIVSAGGFTATTDSDGFYQVSGLAAGTYVVSARHPSYTIANSSPVSVGPSQEGVDLTAVPVISGVSVSPTLIVGGSSATGAVTVGAPAPPGGTAVSLSSDNSLLTVPASVNIPEGSTSVNFPVTSKWVTSKTVATITAAMDLGTSSCTVTLMPTSVFSFTATPNSVPGGGTLTGTVRLTAAAPAGGTTVNVTFSPSVAGAPATLTIPAGKISAAFKLVTPTVSSDLTVRMTAGLNNSSVAASFKILSPSVTSVVVAPTTVIGGNTVNLTVTLSSAAPAGGVLVKFTSSSAISATVPASVTIPAGDQSVTVPVATHIVNNTLSVALHAITGSKNLIAKLTVQAIPLVSVTVDPAQVVGGDGATGTVNVGAVAPPGGLPVRLVSGNTAFAQIPAGVTIAEGQTSATFPVTTTLPGSSQVQVFLNAYLGIQRKNGPILVTPPPDPVVDDQAVSTLEDTPVTVTLTGSESRGYPVTFAVVDQPLHGTLTGDAPNVTYTPDPNYNGTDTFTFKANDGYTDSKLGTVTLTIIPVNDPPVAYDASATIDEETTLNGTVTATDVDNDPLTFAKVSDPVNGTLTLNADGTYTYTPNPLFYGTDTFTFKANDGQADSNVATVTITVNHVNHPPVAYDGANSTVQETPVDGTLVATDADNDPLTFSVKDQPANGTVIVNPDGTYTYTPNPGFTGTDSFTFVANDGLADSNVGTVTVTVTPP